MGNHTAINSLESEYTIKIPKKQKLSQVLEFLFPFLLIGITLELMGRLSIIDTTIIPLPSTIAQKLWEMTWGSNILFKHLFTSFYRLTIGYVLAVTLGITVGALLAINTTIEEMFSPVLDLLISVPTIAWVPVLLITMGLGDRTVIAAIFLGGFFAIAYNTMRGVEMINKSLVNAGKMMGLQGMQLFRSVLLPGSLVAIITGLRLGIGYSWRALVGGEMLSAMVEWGVGKMIYQARYWNDITAMFVGLMIIGVTGLALDRVLLKWLERETVEKWGMLLKR